jgi:glutamyl-tRNA reductase
LHYLVVSFTHKNTNIDTREKLAFNNNLERETFLKNIISYEYIDGAILTSTCNRVEVLASVKNIDSAKQNILTTLSQKSDINIASLEQIVDLYENENAVHHIFTVVSSLDSLVVGETQIAGQFKEAFKFSLEHNFISQQLTRLANYAFKCAKQVRNTTNLGTGSVSVASTAVTKAKKIFNTHNNIKALVIGAGEMSGLTVRHLLKDRFHVILTSRNIKKAQLLADTIIRSNNSYSSDMIEVKPYKDLQILLNETKLLITATSSPYPIITNELIYDVNFTRHWFDIAIPRDIEVTDYKNINIYAVDDLKDIIDQNLTTRADQAKEAYYIVSFMTKEFYKWLGSLDVEPMIKNIYLKSDKIIEKKVKNAINKKFILENDKENITKLCKTIINEFLHPTTSNLRDIKKEPNSDRLINTVKLLYNL